MRWALLQRGLWVHGVKSLGDYAEAALAMTLEGRVGDIRCPTLLTTAENDPLSQGAEALLAELACPKALLRFTAAEGAGDHCEMQQPVARDAADARLARCDPRRRRLTLDGPSGRRYQAASRFRARADAACHS